MKSVSKSALKAKMLEYFRDVEQSGEALVVTDNNRPVLKVVPFDELLPADVLFADIRGRVRIDRRLFKDTSEEWAET